MIYDLDGAGERLLSAFGALGLDSVVGDTPSSCTVTFSPVRRKSARYCTWGVVDGTLDVEIVDMDLDSGTDMVIAHFGRTSALADPRITVRYGFIPYLLLILFLMVGPLAVLSLISLGKVFAIALGVLEMVLSPLLVRWMRKVGIAGDEFFVRSLSRLTSGDESVARDRFSDFLRAPSRMTVVSLILVMECIFVIVTALSLFS
ncbi:MAG: hypothetical protein K9W43_04755 [Candidatus Thorarchaeota archaeon]|nr:hypothetical protein [Candidatus Thorarchaeota archaeon]